MSNAIASLSVWSPTRRNFVRKLLNAQEKKTSFNLTLDHQFDKHLTLSASYDHMNNKWSAKNGLTLDPKWGYKSIDDVNVAINFLRPANHYALNLSYENAKLYTGLLANRSRATTGRHSPRARSSFSTGTSTTKLRPI